MSLHQADKVGHSFPSKPLLLMRNPLPPSRGRGSTSTWTAESFDQAPSLASHPLDAEHPPHLPHEDDHLSLFTPFAPPLSSFQQLLVHCPRGGKVMDQEVNILRCLSPCSRSSFKLDLCTVSTINLVLSLFGSETCDTSKLRKRWLVGRWKEPTRASVLRSNLLLLFQIIVKQKEPDHHSFWKNIK